MGELHEPTEDHEELKIPLWLIISFQHFLLVDKIES